MKDGREPTKTQGGRDPIICFDVALKRACTCVEGITPGTCPPCVIRLAGVVRKRFIEEVEKHGADNP